MTFKNLFSTALLLALLYFPLSCHNSEDEQPKSEYSDKIESVTLLKTTKSWDGTLYGSYPTGQPEISILKISVPLIKHWIGINILLLMQLM